MGIIKDGCISGLLPSGSSSSKAFAIHYPGYPSSMDRALDTLGGTQALIMTRSSQSNKLKLHFRPEDPYAHPAFGELLPRDNFLLKISQNNGKDGQISGNANPVDVEHNIHIPEIRETVNGLRQPETESIVHSTEVEAHASKRLEKSVCADIVAHISEAYFFNGMVDYQHVLAVHADVARKKKRKWLDVEPQFEKHGLMDVDQEDLIMLVPSIFSPKDVPEELVLKPLIDIGLKKTQEAAVQQDWEVDIEPSLALDFSIKEIPKKLNWEKYIPEGSDQWKWQMAVSELFDERPIWNKESLTERLLEKGLKFGISMFRRLLYRIAYYFSNGPFLKFWIRKGYDPRMDPESRIYQKTGFRVPPELRNYCDTAAASGLKHRWADLCAFRVFPYKCQTLLQLYELEDDYIQQEIRKPLTQATCSLATGWFSSHVLDCLRLCIAVRFLSVYPKPGAESFIKSASARFEKSKRMKIIIKEQEQSEDGKQQLHKDKVLNEEREMNDDNEGGEEDNEEDELEDENVEEELDAYEADEEMNFSAEPSSYSSQENISRNYLQDLFGSFPFSGEPGDRKFQDAENSEGEYQIYDQYSDDNYSDDDY